MRWVRRKPVVLAFVTLVLVAIMGVAAGRWYYSDVLKNDALAEVKRDLVTYVRVADATHVRSWNMDPDDYEAAVASFLEDLVE